MIEYLEKLLQIEGAGLIKYPDDHKLYYCAMLSGGIRDLRPGGNRARMNDLSTTGKQARSEV